MPEKCAKCGSDINVVKDGIKCADCPTVCHLKCVGIVTRNKKWKCESCSLESSSNSDSGTTNSSILEAIAAFRRENNDRWDINSTKLDEVQSEMKSIKLDMGKLKDGLEDVNTKYNTVCESVDTLKTRNEQLTVELSAMKQQVLELEQYSRKNNILISGVPRTNKENIYEVLGAIARALKIDFHPSEISTAHRLQGRREDPRPPSIVVCFVSRDTKTFWLAARRKKRSLTAQELLNTFPNSPVYLNEHLTPMTRGIFNGARALMKQKKLATVWTSDCKVMARLTPEHRPFRVRDLQHLAELGKAARQSTAANDNSEATA